LGHRPRALCELQQRSSASRTGNIDGRYARSARHDARRCAAASNDRAWNASICACRETVRNGDQARSAETNAARGRSTSGRAVSAD